MSQTRTTLVRILFGVTIFLAAGLLFWQQLMLGRVLLPQFGSVPTVWLVSLAVFQLLLLGAYAFAHGLRRLPKIIMLIPLALLLAAAIWQHLNYPNLAALNFNLTNDAPSVTLALLGLAGFSLFLLSMMSPLLQRLYSRLPQPDAHDPYFFYSASNFGSFAGLLLFPLLLEPLWGLRFSQNVWMETGGVFVVLLLACLAVSLAAPPEQKSVQSSWAAPARKKFLWAFYAFLPAALSFGATSHLINDIAPVPLLSMVPLALYLLTYVLAFSRRSFGAEWLSLLQPFFAAFYIYREILSGFKPSQLFDIILVLTVFFMTAWRCHRRLADLRPETGSLTTYYLMIALGGALAGLLNIAVIPFIFAIPVEFVLFLILSLIGNWPADREKLRDIKMRPLLLTMVRISIAAVLSIIFSPNPVVARFIFPVATLVALMIFTLMPNLLAALAAALVGLTLIITPPHIALQRDFFGVKRVQDKRLEDGNIYRMLFHGTTCHGIQRRQPQITTEPLLYYAPSGGFYDAVESFHPKHFGVIGLGMGGVACVPKDAEVRFFEIDPGMVRLANDDFTFLKSCPSEVVLGDARLTLAKDTHQYDLFLIDAFSSDSIPVHLLTAEAFDIYRDRLGKDGVLIVHISNRFLDLQPVIAGAARHLGWAGAVKYNDPDPTHFTAAPSEYVALSADAGKINRLMQKGGWKPLEAVAPLPWTDDHIVLIPILHFGFKGKE